MHTRSQVKEPQPANFMAKNKTKKKKKEEEDDDKCKAKKAQT